MLLHEDHPALARVAVCLARGRPGVRPLVFADPDSKDVDYSTPVLCLLSARKEVFPLPAAFAPGYGLSPSRSDLAGFRFGSLARHGFAVLTAEQVAELDSVDRALDLAVDLLLAGPLPSVFDHAAEEVHGTLETFLLEGLKRIAWTPKRLEAVDKLSDEERAALSLSYGPGRVWRALAPLHPGGNAGVYVCRGDEQGPGCGLVFTGRRRDEPRLRCVHCSLKNGRPILTGASNGPSLVQLEADGTPFWAERWEPACRDVLVWVQCAGCHRWFSSAPPAEGAGRSQARAVQHCLDCKRRATSENSLRSRRQVIAMSSRR